MMFKCCECGAVFHEDDAGTYKESRGEFWGEPCYEELMCCPECSCEDIEEYDGEGEEDEEDDE